jgi:hypothetical protein
MVFAVLAAALTVPGVAWAQGASRYTVNYFNNAHVSGAPDATYRVVNASTDVPLNMIGGNLCAMNYVFGADQQLKECCGCLVTPNGLLILSVNNDLTNNPFTPGIPPDGSIFTVPTLATTGAGPLGSNSGCDPGASALSGAGHVETWITHYSQADSTSPFLITETHPFEEFYNTAEVAVMAAKCLIIESAVINLGSNHGLCHCQGEANPGGVDPPIVGTLP